MSFLNSVVAHITRRSVIKRRLILNISWECVREHVLCCFRRRGAHLARAHHATPKNTCNLGWLYFLHVVSDMTSFWINERWNYNTLGFRRRCLGCIHVLGPRFIPREGVWPWSHQPRIQYCRYQQQRQHRIQVLGLLVLRVFDVRQCFNVRDHPVLVEEGGENNVITIHGVVLVLRGGSTYHEHTLFRSQCLQCVSTIKCEKGRSTRFLWSVNVSEC